MSGKKITKQYCSVPQCKNYRTGKITIHRFPADKIFKEKWRIALRIGKAITSGMMVCSEHFLPSDFYPASQYTLKKFIKKNAIPSQKIPVRSQAGISSSKIVQKTNSNRKKVISASDSEMEIEELEENIAEHTTSVVQDDIKTTDEINDTPEEIIAEHAYCAIQDDMKTKDEINDIPEEIIAEYAASVVQSVMKIEDETNDTPEENMAEYAASVVQSVMETESEINISPVANTDEVRIQGNTLTNIKQNLNFTNYLLDCSSRLREFTGLTIPLFEIIIKLVSNTLRGFSSVNKTNINKKICLVLTKLKLDLSFKALGILYEISSTTAQSHFHQYIQILNYSLKQAIYFTAKEQNLKKLPLNFQKYNEVRIVIDTTEIPIQKSKCLQCSTRSYSHYKKSHTAKFLISTCPAGLICHVSSAYGGRVSDKAIFNKEKIIDHLDTFHGAVMVEKGVTLIRPPCLKKKSKPSKEEALETASIAKARVHVENTIQRIKIFKIFTNRLEWTLVPYLDEMMVVVCALVNLTQPILTNDKF